mgnify:CR=1 FL=1|jgi:SAM-dependent methyltransferase
MLKMRKNIIIITLLYFIMVYFKDIKYNKHIFLYHGDIYKNMKTVTYTNKNFIGLSLKFNNSNHILHDITNPYDLFDNSVDIVQSEDTLEHIEYYKLVDCINEIYRVLKPNGLFRLSLPDYDCDILYNRSLKDNIGNIYFDKLGGGNYDYNNKKVINGGHLWFPTYTNVKNLLDKTKFNNINYLHYYDNKKPILNEINYNYGYIHRTPDNDNRVKNPRRPLSLVVDLKK